MAIIEFIIAISLCICAVSLAIIFIYALIEALIQKAFYKKNKEKKEKELLHTLQVVSEILSKIPEEEKTKKKTTTRKKKEKTEEK